MILWCFDQVSHGSQRSLHQICMVAAYSEREAKFVAAELRILFHKVGFPLIFYTNNGTEFINVLVYNLLIETNPDILLVSGASRTHHHQGSVEVGNRSIKTIIHKELVNSNIASKSKSTEPVGWVSVLLQMTSAMNGSIDYRQSLIIPYCHVFTQDFEVPLGIPAMDRSKICSIQSLDKYVNDPALLEKLCIIDNEIQSKNSNSHHVPCNVSRTINMNTFAQPLSNEGSVGFNMSSSDNANKKYSSKQDETTPIVAEVLKSLSWVEHDQIHDVSEVTEVSQDYDNVDDCMPQTQLKSHGIKRKYGDIESQSFEQVTSLSLSYLDKKIVAGTIAS